ncbi:MAG: GNAT family N-acetyltransferase [Bacteroidia bacterium]
MNWIDGNTTLVGGYIKLVPMDEIHFEDLTFIGNETKIWEFIPTDMSSKEKRFQTFLNAMIEREKGAQFPFIVYHQHDNKIIGSTRLMNIEPKHMKLEIGWTWLHPDYWATAVNLECKLLLLNFCFEELKAIRVQLKTDENNIRSQKAILKIGAQFEGVLRNDWIRDNGTIRNSAYFSIINSEWKNARENLNLIIKEKTNATSNK